MSRTYFAYADSLDGQTDFSLTRGDRQYFGRFTDENDRDYLVSEVQASVYPGNGRNLFVNVPDNWEVGSISSDTGANASGSNRLRSKGYYPILPNAKYVLQDFDHTTMDVSLLFYTADKTYLNNLGTGSWFEDATLSFSSGNTYAYFRVVVRFKDDRSMNLGQLPFQMKLEMGIVATLWSSAPEDLLAELDEKINDPDSYVWEEIRASTNADWWSTQGVIRSKAVITMADSTKVEVYGTDYIKGWSLNMRSSSGKDKPVFDFVSDSLEMTLYSLDNDFNPFAEGSQYYGKFILGTKIDLFVRVDYLGHGDELKWDALGQYKIAEITVSDTGTECYVLAYDYGYNGIENSKQQVLAPLVDVETSEDIEDFLGYVFPEYEVTVEEGITELPKKLFPLGNKLETMNEFLAALFCFSRCNGDQITIRSFDDIPRATLDRTNIVSASPQQSLVQQYDGSVVKWNELGLEQGTEIVSLTADFGEAGVKVYPNVSVDDKYINKLEEVVTFTSDGSDVVDVAISDVYSNALTLTVESDSAGEVQVKINAETVVFNDITDGDLDNTESIYEIRNKYIQTQAQAEAIRGKIDQFITTKNKHCGVEVRFNPLLRLAWLVECKHSDYDLDIEAYIVEQTLTLSSDAPAGQQTIMLLNSEAVL